MKWYKTFFIVFPVLSFRLKTNLLFHRWLFIYCITEIFKILYLFFVIVGSYFQKQLFADALHNRFSWKLAKFTGKHLCQSHFLIKLRASRLHLYLRDESSTGVFLWILLNFQKLSFSRTPQGCCQKIFSEKDIKNVKLLGNTYVRVCF